MKLTHWNNEENSKLIFLEKEALYYVKNVFIIVGILITMAFATLVFWALNFIFLIIWYQGKEKDKLHM